jgi:dihydrofolate reductase
LILTQIAAMAKNRVIGVNGKLPWDLPEDMKFFKETTMGHIMIMGRKTFESMPGVLPKRFHIVISRSKEYKFEHKNVLVVDSIESAISAAKKQMESQPAWGKEVFIIGGGEIFKQAMKYTNKLYLTIIDKDFSGDSFFPELDLNQFELIKKERRDGDGRLPFDFCVYHRILLNTVA